jgi:hypothetical protein
LEAVFIAHILQYVGTYAQKPTFCARQGLGDRELLHAHELHLEARLPVLEQRPDHLAQILPGLVDRGHLRVRTGTAGHMADEQPRVGVDTGPNSENDSAREEASVEPFHVWLLFAGLAGCFLACLGTVRGLLTLAVLVVLAIAFVPPWRIEYYAPSEYSGHRTRWGPPADTEWVPEPKPGRLSLSSSTGDFLSRNWCPLDADLKRARAIKGITRRPAPPAPRQTGNPLDDAFLRLQQEQEDLTLAVVWVRARLATDVLAVEIAAVLLATSLLVMSARAKRRASRASGSA